MTFYRPGGDIERINAQYDECYTDTVNDATGWLPVNKGDWIAINITRASLTTVTAAASVISKIILAPAAQVALELKTIGGQKDVESWTIHQWQNTIVAEGKRADRAGFVRLRLNAITPTGGDGLAMALQVTRTNDTTSSSDISVLSGGSGGGSSISSTTADMFAGIIGTAPASSFVVNSKGDASGTNFLQITKTGVATLTGTLGVTGNETVGGTVDAIGYKTRPGLPGPSGGNAFNINWLNGFPDLWIDNTNLGHITLGGVGNFVLKTGDTMSGALSTPQIHVNGDTSGGYYFGPGGSQYLRYEAGSGFNLAGGILLTSSNIQANGNIVSNLGGIWVNSAQNAGMIYDGSNFLLRAGTPSSNIFFQNGAGTVNWGSIGTGGFTCAASITATSGDIVCNNGGIYDLVGRIVSRAPSTSIMPSYQFQDSGANFRAQIYYDTNTTSLKFSLSGAPIEPQILTSGVTRLGAGMACMSPLSGSYNYSGYRINFNYPGIEMWIDTTYIGNISFTSDYRTKKDVVPLPDMWTVVKNLKPIKYTQAQFSPPSHDEHLEANGHLFEADDIERWGFLAHELQETLTPSAATGVKDDPAAIQSPNPFTLIAALTKALQEAMARIETLEAKVP